MPEANREKAKKQPAPQKGRRHYSEKEKIAVLSAMAASGNNYNQVSKIFKVHINTIRRWVNATKGVNEDIQSSVTDKKGEIADQLEQFVRLALGDVIGKIQEGKGGAPGSLMLAVGIALDKMQLLRGEATERTELKLGDVLERIKARAASAAGGGTKGAGKDGNKGAGQTAPSVRVDPASP